MGTQELPSELFADPATASRNLLTLHESFITSGTRFGVEDFTHALNAQLVRSPDPDLALTNLLRFTEISVSKASLFTDLLHYPVYMEVIMRLFGFSRYFADILVRDPGLFRWLTASEAMLKPLSAKALASDIARAMEMFSGDERRLNALKRMYRREVLRIGARDILESADFIEVTRQLSTLADALVDAVVRVAVLQLAGSFGPEELPTPFCVIGLGKLGGGELNYSSDIDIIFVYDEEGEGVRPSGKTFTYHEYFNKLAEKIVQNLSQPSNEGYLYRVDTRLRPESGAGPLARSLRSFLVYYESRGELWERQMLIKARPVGGDCSFGERFLAQLQPFVYPRTHFQSPLESIARIKSRIESSVGEAANIKLMAGGIRDIEFVAQALQLLNGGALPALRERNTLRALDILAGEGLLSAEERATLSESYVFYRTLEHRLQMMLNTQTHTLPGDPRAAGTVARMMGWKTGEEFLGAVSQRLAAVKAIFDRVLAVRPGTSESRVETLVDGGADETTMMHVLTKLGFRDGRKAMRSLKLLTSGSSLTELREIDSRAREAFRSIAGVLFDDLSRTPDPDLTLDGFTAIASSQKLPHQLYTQIADPRFRKFIVDICAVSPRFARGLSANPLLLECLASDIRSLAEGDPLALPPAGDLIVFKNQQELRAGVRHVLGFSSGELLSAELTRLADFVLAEVMTSEMRKGGTAGLPLAVFAVGKYGTGEITFDADLDLIFVSGSVGKDDAALLERVASMIVKRISAVSEHGKLYDVDVRLRPEGVSAPLVVSAAAYEKYLQGRASLWERQSLTRLRFVCGEAALAAQVVRTVGTAVYERPLPEDWVDRIVAMRRKMESRSKTMSQTFLDVKLGAGGMADVEFYAQMLQLKNGAADPGMRGKPVLEILRQYSAAVGGAETTDRFERAYELFRELMKLSRITLMDKSSILPEGEKLETLARVFNRSSAEVLRTRVATTMKEVRTSFLSASERLAGSA